MTSGANADTSSQSMNFTGTGRTSTLWTEFAVGQRPGVDALYQPGRAFGDEVQHDSFDDWVSMSAGTHAAGQIDHYEGLACRVFRPAR